MSDEDYKRVCEQIGACILIWAHAENTLDLSLALCARDFPAVIDPKAGFPVSLKRKIKLLRHCLDSVEDLLAVQNDGYALLEGFMAVKDKRHDIIHGMAWYLFGETFGSARMLIINKKPTFTKRFQTLGDITRFIQECEILMDKSVAFFLKIAELRPDPVNTFIAHYNSPRKSD